MIFLLRFFMDSMGRKSREPGEGKWNSRYVLVNYHDKDAEGWGRPQSHSCRDRFGCRGGEVSLSARDDRKCCSDEWRLSIFAPERRQLNLSTESGEIRSAKYFRTESAFLKSDERYIFHSRLSFSLCLRVNKTLVLKDFMQMIAKIERCRGGSELGGAKIIVKRIGESPIKKRKKGRRSR